VTVAPLLRRMGHRLAPRRLMALARAAVPVHWRYRGSFARACLRNMGVTPWARLSPLQRSDVDFALSTNERGRWAADVI
jgi:hypothetical protein